MATRSAEYEKNNQIMMAIHPSWTISHPVKRTILYALVFVSAALLSGWLFMSDTEWALSAEVKKILYVTLFLLIGTGHIFSFPKWLPHIYNKESKTGIIYSLLLALLMGITTFLLFVFTRFEKPQMALLITCAFLLPVTIQYAWHYFDLIAAPETYQPWFLPNEIATKKMVAVLENNFPVEIRLKLNYYDIAETSFKVVIPGKLTLGKMFHEFLLNKGGQSVKIQLFDQDKKPYAWRFLLQKPFSMTNLDPNLTFRDNKIRPKDVILAERLKISSPSPDYESTNNA